MKITLFSNSIAASYIYSVALISTSKKLFNQIAASSITFIATIAIATAIAINKIATSLHATKKITFASKSQIASKFAINSLIRAKIETSTSSLLAYRAISSLSPEYQAKP